MSSPLPSCGSRSARRTRALATCTTLWASLLATSPANALPRTWIGGNVDWVDGGSTANWNPADEPDSDDEAIFNTNNSIPMGSDNVINGLTMSASSELLLNGHQLSVDGPTSLTGSGTRVEVSGATAGFNAADVTIGNNATLLIDGGSIQSLIVGAASAAFTIDANGTFSGNGELSMTDSLAAVTTVINNNGTITASNPSTLILVPPVAATLHISAVDGDARLDLDGSLEGGVVNVNRNQTLDVDVPLSDIFNGTLTMAQETKLDMASSWILGAGATVTVDNGAVGGLGGAPAGKATIAGSSFSQNSGTITLVDGDGTLQFDAPFTMNGGSFVANGHVIFNATATIGAAANFTRPTGTSHLTVEAGRTLTINQANFDLDGQLNTTSELTVNAGATLIANLGDYDPDQVTNSYSSIINLNNGDVTVTTADATFVMAGTLNMLSDVDGQITTWNGEPIAIGNDSGSSDSHLNVSGAQQSQFAPTITFNSDADVNVAAGATLALLGTVNFNTVNAANSAEFTGSGRIAFSGPVHVNEAVTLNMVGGQIDLDGLDSVGDTVNVDAPLVINVATMASFGRVNGGGGVNTLDVNNSVGTGVLTVNLDDPNAKWTLNGPGVMNLVNDVAPATLLAGNDVNVYGTVNVNGDVRTTARLDIAGIVNVNTVAEPFRLAGGDNVNDPNTLAGGTIGGLGAIGADSGKELRGFGTINTSIDFDGTAKLRADGGTLTINGAIVDADTVGTADADGTFHVTNAWNNGVTAGVQLNGGVVSGGAMTNDVPAGVSGHGLVSARVINNSRLSATDGTLVVQTGANDNDWDGAGGGQLRAIGGGNVLEIRDTGAAFAFSGNVTATNGGRVYANGFGLNFQPASTIDLTAATLQTDESTDLGGSVTVAAGLPSTIQVQNNRFLTFEAGSSTTLNGNLQLVNNNINIETGATFAGGGALIIPDGSHMVADNLADIGALLDMQGAFRPGNFNGIGRVDLFDYQQGATGELYVELIGTALNAFDRLVASGDVVLDGYLNIDIDEISPGVPFVPSLGQTFNIITGNTVTGTFDYADVSGMPAGLAFHLNYLPNAVQLQVVNKPIFSADFDEDGDVDPTDLAIWKGAYDLNQLGDADGDNDSDGADFLLWQQQFGSVPAVAAAQPAAGAVPEPSGALLFVLGGAFAFCLRSR